VGFSGVLPEAACLLMQSNALLCLSQCFFEGLAGASQAGHNLMIRPPLPLPTPLPLLEAAPVDNFFCWSFNSAKLLVGDAKSKLTGASGAAEAATVLGTAAAIRSQTKDLHCAP
jgi:hypothetical protein